MKKPNTSTLTPCELRKQAAALLKQAENKPPRPPPRPHCGSCTHSVPPLPGHFSLSSCAKGHLTRDVMIYHNPCADFTPKTEAL